MRTAISPLARSTRTVKRRSRSFRSFEAADGGTVFLDEVGELRPAVQAKLLRSIETREVLRVGALRTRSIDVRFVSATNRDLEAEVARRAFRQDLFFRLNGFTVKIPPLRERQDEIPGLARTFVGQACARAGSARPPAIAAETLALLRRYPWPGNIRELRNVMERALLFCGDGPIEPAHVSLEKLAGRASAETVRRAAGPVTAAGTRAVLAAAAAAAAAGAAPSSPPPPAPRPAGSTEAELRAELADLERKRIVEALERCAGNQSRAAKLLGMSRRTLVSRLGRYKLPRPRKS